LKNHCVCRLAPSDHELAQHVPVALVWRGREPRDHRRRAQRPTPYAGVLPNFAGGPERRRELVARCRLPTLD
jgi:hypothetical protein